MALRVDLVYNHRRMGVTLRERPRRNIWRDAALLTAFCAVVYLFGLTAHGLTNWQESQRALVAREMFGRGEWLVPTVHGEPYIAKPPMIYWIQMAIGHARRALGFEPFTNEFEVRLTVALGGIAGVLATYFGARSMFRGRGDRRIDGESAPPLVTDDARIGDDAAWLAALGLASGVLYVRSSRIGELDVLIVPFVVTAIAAIIAAWRRHLVGGRMHWAALGVATMMSCGAALTKGPPALLVVGLGGYGSILLLSRRGEGAASEDEHGVGRFGVLAALLGAIGFFVLSLAIDDRIASVWHAIGLVFFTALGALLGWGAVRLMRPARLGAWFRAFHATHPIAVLGIPVLVTWWWKSAVSSRVGESTVAALAAAEVEDNLRILVLDSPTKNLGFMLYGIAPMSVIALVGAWSLVRRRREMPEGQRVPLVWCGLSFAAFSVLGKGVARYLTPAWPAVAMVGGLWLARQERERQRRNTPPLMAWATALFIASGLAQGWWYGVGREIWNASRSPRDVIRELLPRIEAGRLGVWALADPALDFYAGQRVEQWGGRGQPKLEDLVTTVRGAEGPYYLLAATNAFGSRDDGLTLQDSLERAGIDVRPFALNSEYTWRADGAPVVVWELHAASAR